MRVLLVYPSIDCPPGISHGLAAIAGVLESAGHETRLLHVCEKLWPVPKIDEIKALVADYAPGLIGFSAMSQQYDWCVEVARALDDEFGLPTVVGGVHCTMVPDEVTEQGHFDYVCVGEGEYAMLELVERLANGGDTTAVSNMRIPASRLKSVRLRDGCRDEISAAGAIVNPVGAFPDLATLPPKKYDLFDLDHIIRVRDGWMGMLTSRGCPYKCTYCFNKEIVDRYIEDGGAQIGKEYLRHYSVGRIIDEIRMLKARHPHLDTLIFDDDLFTLNRAYVHEFCEAYIDAGIGLPFVVNAHVQKFDEDMAEVLARAGCLIVKYGLESGSDWIRRNVLWRYMTNQKIEESFAAAHRFGLHTSAFVMFGLPHETREHILETVRLCARIGMGRFRWAIFFPFPGTAGFRIAQESGLIDYERMKGLGNYFDGSCLRFGDDQDLFVEKLGYCFHWWVNSETEWESAPAYRDLVEELESLDRAAWDREKHRVRDRDRELSERFLAAGIPHYSVRYSHVMAVHSDFVSRERRRRLGRPTPLEGLAAYSLD